MEWMPPPDGIAMCRGGDRFASHARKRVLDAARERMAQHRRRGARFDRAEIVEAKTKLSRVAPSKSAERTRDVGRAAQRSRDR